MNYTDWNNAVLTIFELPIADPASASPSTDANYNLIYPRAIEYAELRMQRDLDFLNTTTFDTASVTAGNFVVALPTNNGVFVVLNSVFASNVVLNPTSKGFLEFVLSGGGGIVQGTPTYWCPRDQTHIKIAPAADATYSLMFEGTIRYTPLSASNASNFLSTYLPDLYLAASCIFLSGYQRDFGAQSEDPQMAQSWENQYTKLLGSAGIEEARKKLVGRSPSDMGTPGPLPTPPMRVS